MGFFDGSVVKNPPANAREPGSIPAWGKSLGEENGNPLEYSCLGHPMDLAGYNPWGRKRVGHNLATKQQQTYLFGCAIS